MVRDDAASVEPMRPGSGGHPESGGGGTAGAAPTGGGRSDRLGAPGQVGAEHPVLDALEDALGQASANAHRIAGALSRPVSLVRVGRKRRRARRVELPASPDGRVMACGVYSHGRCVTMDVDHSNALRLARTEREGFAWLGLFEPSYEQLAAIAEEYGLDKLAVEDAVTGGQRPKLEQYENHLFVVLKTTSYVAHTEVTGTSEVVTTGEIMIFLGEDFVVTVRHGQHGEMTRLRGRLEAAPEMLRHGPTSVLHAICDSVVDNYLDTVERIQVDVDQIEAGVFRRDQTPSTESSYQMKRELLELKHAVQPLAGPLRTLTTDSPRLVDAGMRRYFRDVADHLEQVSERIEHFDELLSSVLQATLTQVTIAQNEDMRRISAWVAIAAVPTALAGIYGMNFEHMPELRQTWGYPAVLAVMATACLFLYRAFKRNGWLLRRR
ncbi:magnesium/cobalt transporter CorA [Candidatus Frankia alpina]|uniref:Magnesium transport protein CorA n=1 Tax=Candidatus Frankia alpina TaxID=2699483 RepID=A0A4S5DLT3_9ACTN|nr:magnesium/cobalt transporter CorA [Candidatus Frankia alpina]THJ58068.1 magnesium/cobalt transporter CorA [Candidatus Frankia alpina]